MVMAEHRWLRAIGPGVIALGAVVAVGSSTQAARVRPSASLACDGGAGARVAASRETGPMTLADLGTGAWMRLDPTLDRDGALVGQRLSMGIHERRAARVMTLPAESFAAGPFGRLLLVGADDGAASRLFTIDVATGCTSSVAEENAVIRRATISPGGDAVYESRVDRATRADLGVWRRPLDGSEPASRLLDPLPVDDRFGRTWTTEFTWSLEGDRLAVQSCGETACRTRVIEPVSAGRPVRLVADPALGPLVGLAGPRLISYAACRGLPCPLLSVDADSGDQVQLTDAAGLATLAGAGADARVVHEWDGPSGRHLRSIAPDGRDVSDLGAIPTGLRLMPDTARSATGTRLPPDWVLLAPDGRLPADGDADTVPPTLRHVPDGRSVPLDEVSR
jgi:hypothetical protein